jgi:FtsH-binding integral membrane protein
MYQNVPKWVFVYFKPFLLGMVKLPLTVLFDLSFLGCFLFWGFKGLQAGSLSDNFRQNPTRMNAEALILQRDLDYFFFPA